MVHVRLFNSAPVSSWAHGYSHLDRNELNCELVFIYFLFNFFGCRRRRIRTEHALTHYLYYVFLLFLFLFLVLFYRIHLFYCPCLYFLFFIFLTRFSFFGYCCCLFSLARSLYFNIQTPPVHKWVKRCEANGIIEVLEHVKVKRGETNKPIETPKSFGKWLKIIFSLQRERECRHTFSTVNTTWFQQSVIVSAKLLQFSFELLIESAIDSQFGGKESNYSFNRACTYNQTQLVRWQPQKIRRLKPFFFLFFSFFFFAFPPSPAVPFRPKAFYF